MGLQLDDLSLKGGREEYVQGVARPRPSFLLSLLFFCLFLRSSEEVRGGVRMSGSPGVSAGSCGCFLAPLRAQSVRLLSAQALL